MMTVWYVSSQIIVPDEHLMMATTHKRLREHRVRMLYSNLEELLTCQQEMRTEFVDTCVV